MAKIAKLEKELREFLERICNTLQNLSVDRCLFGKAYMHILEKQKQGIPLAEMSVLYSDLFAKRMQSWFTCDFVMGIRKLTSNGEGINHEDVSIPSFLKRLQNAAGTSGFEIYLQDRFCNLWIQEMKSKVPAVTDHLLRKEAEVILKKTMEEKSLLEIIQQDLELIHSNPYLKNAKILSNKYLGHEDRKIAANGKFTIDDPTKLLQLLQDITGRYYRILNATDIVWYNNISFESN